MVGFTEALQIEPLSGLGEVRLKKWYDLTDEANSMMNSCQIRHSALSVLLRQEENKS